MMRNRQIWRSCLVVLLSLGMMLACVPLWAAAETVTVEVAGLLGTVTVKRAASEKTFNAFVGLKLKQGDVVTVAKGGEVVINIGEDKTIKGLSDSSFKISSLSGTDADSQAGFTLIKGTVFNEVRAPQSSQDGMTVKTGSTVAGVRGTTYTVSLRAADGVTVRTLEGSVFLDTVLGRLEADSNASLVTGQQTVTAGQGSSTAREGVFQLSITDLTAAELGYIVEHPHVFEPDFVAEAETALEAMPAEPPTTQASRQIVYEPVTEPQPAVTVPDGGGSTEPTQPPEPSVTRTLTIQYGGDANFTGYYGFTATYDVTEVSPNQGLDAYLNMSTNCVLGKVGYYHSGWSLTNTGPQGISGTADFGIQVPMGQLPQHAVLYPLFTETSAIGTNVNPFIIDRENFPHFNAFARSNPDKHYLLNVDIDYASYVWPAGWQWTPIGTGDHPFTGSFYGNDKTIRNFSMTATQQYAGLFGCIKGFENNLVVFNLTLDNAAITAGGSTEAVGSLVGNLISGTVKNCKVSGTVSAAGSNVQLSVGGLVGLADQLTGSGVVPPLSASVTDSTFGGTVTANATGINAYAGGIAGKFASFSLMNCTADASVTAQSDSAACAGGIAGAAYASIEKCQAAGSFTVRAVGGESSAGGIAGSFGGDYADQCWVSGGNIEAVSATGAGGAYAGGIVGQMTAGDGIRNCYTEQTQITSGHSAGRVGGIVGSTTAGVSTSYILNVDMGVSNVSTAYAGGIAGYADFVRACVVFSGTINQGDVSVTASYGRMYGSAASSDNNYGWSNRFFVGNTPISDAYAGGKHGANLDSFNQNFLESSPMGWNFTAVWRWDMGYPVLRVFNPPGSLPIVP